MRILVTKEFVDLLRSGTIKKMTISYSIPLIVLLLMAWMVDFAEAPIPINLLTYAPFLGFFGFNFYSWLPGIDSPESAFIPIYYAMIAILKEFFIEL